MEHSKLYIEVLVVLITTAVGWLIWELNKLRSPLRTFDIYFDDATEPEIHIQVRDEEGLYKVLLAYMDEKKMPETTLVEIREAIVDEDEG